MRSDIVVIGGKEYPVKGLSVSQSLKTDLESFDARQSRDRDALTTVRLRRIAMSLQNGDAYLPDIKSGKNEAGEYIGQKSAKSLPLADVIGWLDSDVFSDMLEFYEAEKVVIALADPVKAKNPETAGAQDGAGEAIAPE